MGLDLYKPHEKIGQLLGDHPQMRESFPWILYHQWLVSTNTYLTVPMDVFWTALATKFEMACLTRLWSPTTSWDTLGFSRRNKSISFRFASLTNVLATSLTVAGKSETSSSMRLRPSLAFVRSSKSIMTENSDFDAECYLERCSLVSWSMDPLVQSRDSLLRRWETFWTHALNLQEANCSSCLSAL